MQGLILLTLSRPSFTAINGRYCDSRHAPNMSSCDYDLFAKKKEPQRGTRYSTREGIIGAVERAGSHCWASTEVDALRVYDAFHKFVRRWYTWGGVTMSKEYKGDYLR
jgi:hypothetical protein